MSPSKENSINISDDLQKWVFEMLELGLDCFSEGVYRQRLQDIYQYPTLLTC
jgi:hypothetical protein